MTDKHETPENHPIEQLEAKIKASVKSRHAVVLSWHDAGTLLNILKDYAGMDNSLSSPSPDALVKSEVFAKIHAAMLGARMWIPDVHGMPSKAALNQLDEALRLIDTIAQPDSEPDVFKITLSKEEADKFLKLLNDPPEPNEALRKLLAKIKPTQEAE